VSRLPLLVIVLWLGTVSDSLAQNDRRLYAGALLGISTLSADGRSVTGASGTSLSLYAPENGLALDAFAGLHLAPHFSIQASYMWNRNDLTLFSAIGTEDAGGFYEQERRSTSNAVTRSVSSGLVGPTHDISSTHVALRSAVGVDIAVARHVSVRYSFSETISRNPISPHLTPPGRRRLANFQNLFGVIGRF